MIVKTLALYLQSQGLGTTTQDMFIEYLPDAPDNAVCLYTTGGFNPPDSAVLGYDTPTLQVRTRNTSAEAAHTKAMNIYATLQGIANTTLDVNGIPSTSGVFFVSIQALQTSPVILGRDSAQRYEYTQNYACEVRNLTEHRQ